MPLASFFSDRRLFYRIASYALFFLVAAAAFHGYRNKGGLEGEGASAVALHQGFTLATALDETADRPFVFRTLLPSTANALNALLPQPLVDRLYRARNSDGVLLHEKFSPSIVERDRTYFARYWILFFLELLAYFLTTIVCYYFCCMYGFSRPVSALSTCIFMLLLPYFLEPWGYFYDCPEILFFLLSAMAALRGRWAWLMPLAALATLNKESYLPFISVLYPFLRQRLTREKSGLALALVAIPSILVNIYVHWIFRYNPGGNAQVHFIDQLKSVRDILLLSHPRATYGILQPPTENILALLFLLWTIALGWKLLAPTLRQHFWIALCINLPLFAVLGYPGEIRTLSMLYISLVVLLASHIEHWSRLSAEAPAREEARVPAGAPDYASPPALSSMPSLGSAGFSSPRQ
jgi:hypothetical protein